MTLSLKQVAKLFEHDAADVAISSWSIDSRTVERGAVYFAIKGETHDGHAFVRDVFRKGAAAAVVEQDFKTLEPGLLIHVNDTLQGLTDLATWARTTRNWRVTAVTGSAGKTTTKDAIAHLLSTEIPTGKNAGNLNNHIGLPLSLLRAPDNALACVIEMGMNHAGEIRHLASIAKPEIGVVTNVGTAHIENFDSIAGVAAAKRELVESLPPDGVAVLNADDPIVSGFARAHAGRSVQYGFSDHADVRATAVEPHACGNRFRAASTDFDTPLEGRIGVLNTLAAIAVAGEYGIAPERLKDAVRSLPRPKMRGERIEHNGILIFNDSYNSNPEAAKAMLDVLSAQPARRHIAVLGEMLELGQWAETLHAGVGSYAAGCGVSVLVGIRGSARHIVEGALRNGLPADSAFFFDTPAEAGDFLKSAAIEGDAILFKGSRGTQVEKALERFLA